jgi:hypothetical protein
MKNVLVVLFLVVALQANAQNIGRGLMINEVYIGSASNTDQYIEIYNPQSTTQYLDGCMIVLFDTTGGQLSAGALTNVRTAWKFPGSPGGKTLPVKSKEFVVVAADVSKHSGGLDLTSAAYEARASNALPNKNAKQLFNMSPAMTYPGLTPAATGDAIVLTDGTDATIADGVKVTSILDAMQYGLTIKQGNFPQSVDSMLTGGQYLKAGYAMERNAAGVTTHSSYNDFSLQYPTPGTEHATQQQPVTPADLQPFDLGRFVAFHQFDTASAGAAPSEFLSSQIVMQTGLSFQSQTGVALIRDSSFTTGSSSTVSDLHYHVTSAKDLEAFADDQLLQYMFGNFSTNLTAPNQWIPYLKMTSGQSTPYSLTTITGSYSTGTLTVPLSIPITGVYKGIERVTVAKGTFDSAYRFDLTAHVHINYGFGQDSIIVPTSIWFIKGIGVIKRSNPFVTKTIATQTIPVNGSERDMYAFGIQSRSIVDAHVTPESRAIPYPNPVNMKFYLAHSKALKSVTIFDSRGIAVSYQEFGDIEGVPQISVTNLSSGHYTLKSEYVDGISDVSPLVIRR